MPDLPPRVSILLGQPLGVSETFEFAVIEKPADGDPEPTPTTTTATSNPFATLETLEQGVEYVVFVEGCGVATPVIVNQCELPCTVRAYNRLTNTRNTIHFVISPGKRRTGC